MKEFLENKLSVLVVTLILMLTFVILTASDDGISKWRMLGMVALATSILWWIVGAILEGIKDRLNK